MKATPTHRKPATLIYAAVCAAVFAVLVIPFVMKKPPAETVTFRRDLMGTIVEITVPVGPEAEPATKKAYAEIERLEALLSSYRSTSDVSRISAAAGEGPVKVSAECMDVLSAALKVARLSHGAFDPTIGALAGAWGFSGEKGSLPTREQLSTLLPLVDYTAVAIDRAASTVRLEREGMVLNLGGVAKGYIVGAAIRVLKENGVKRGIVKAGGDLSVFHAPGATEKPFVIGIQDPRKKGALLGEAHVVEGAVTTSGDYERFFIKDGVRYHHILDPKTGMPAMLSRSVTVVSEDPTFADALSTAVFVMGSEEGMRLIEGLDGVEAAIVDARGRLTLSSGFEFFKK